MTPHRDSEFEIVDVQSFMPSIDRQSRWMVRDRSGHANIRSFATKAQAVSHIEAMGAVRSPRFGSVWIMP